MPLASRVPVYDYDVILPARDAQTDSATVEVRASSWITAVRVALGDRGESLGGNVLCDLQPDGRVRVLDADARRAYEVRRRARTSDVEGDDEARQGAWTSPDFDASPEARVRAHVERAVDDPMLALTATERAAMARAVVTLSASLTPPAGVRETQPATAEPLPTFDLEGDTFDDLLGTVLEELGWVYEHGESQGLDEVASRALDLAIRLVPSAGGAVLLASLGERDLFFAAAHGPKSDALLGRRVPLDRGIASFCVREGVAVSVPRVGDDRRHYRELADEIEHLPRNIACAPIKVDDRVFGAIELLDKDGDAGYTSVDVALLTHVASQLAHWIQLQI